MNAFLAVLKDSYREARDGWVVNAMLIIIGIMLVLTLSLSYTPAPAETALTSIVKRFTVVFPERGKSVIPVETPGAFYQINSVEAVGPNEYKFKLKVDGDPEGKLRNQVPVLNLFSAEDKFRASIVNWTRPAGPTRKGMVMRGMGFLEMAEPQPVSKEESKAVSDELMADFLQHQFAVNGGIDVAKIVRISKANAEPNYEFDVLLNSGSGVRGWPHTVKIFFGAVTVSNETPLGTFLWIIEEKIVNGFIATLALLISIVITAFFIPNMLRKGSLDLLITKPISRNSLLVYKYFGGLVFIGMLSVVCVGGMWLVIGARSGYWDPKFLLLSPIITFTFGILYSVSTLFGVLTRSGIVAILFTVGFCIFLYVIGLLKTQLDLNNADPATADRWPAWAEKTVSSLHTVLPRYKDLDRLTTKLISDGTLTPIEKFYLTNVKAGYPDTVETFLASSAFIALMLTLACWRFSTRDG